MNNIFQERIKLAQKDKHKTHKDVSYHVILLFNETGVKRLRSGSVGPRRSVIDRCAYRHLSHPAGRPPRRALGVRQAEPLRCAAHHRPARERCRIDLNETSVLPALSPGTGLCRSRSGGDESWPASSPAWCGDCTQGGSERTRAQGVRRTVTSPQE